MPVVNGKLLILSLACLVFAGCADPEVTDMKRYAVTNLPEVQTYLRAAHNQYEDSRSKSELIIASTIANKVVPQLEKYKEALQRLEIETGRVEGLNEKGITRVNEAIKQLQNYRRVLLSRDSHAVLRARIDADQAVDAIKSWQTEVEDAARDMKIEVSIDRLSTR